VRRGPGTEGASAGRDPTAVAAQRGFTGTAAGILALQRSVGNRGVAALLGRQRAVQRLVPSVAPIAPAQEPGGDQASAAEETAGLAAVAHRRADARRLLPDEVQEVGALGSLARPQGPGESVMGRGTRKLLDAVDRLGTRRAGSPSDYKRDPASAEGLPSFVAGALDDPDGRITITADGALEVMRTKRVQPRAKKGQPPPPPTVTHDTVVLDLLGQTFKLEKKKHEKGVPDSYYSVADSFLMQAQTAVEGEAQAAVLGPLRKSATPIAGGDPDADHMTVGEITSEATSGVYLQRSYVSDDPQRPTELLKKVMGAFDELRAEFEAFKPPIALALMGFYPSHAQLARAFAAKLQPALFLTAAAAQSDLDQATAAQTSAQAATTAASAELAALKGRKGVPKAEKAAYTAELTAAQARVSAAQKALAIAKRQVSDQTRRRDGLVEEREKFATTIAWILDPANTTESRGAKTVGSLCNVLSFFLYAKAIGLVSADTDFKDYYLAEVKAGRIRYYVGDHADGVFWGEGSPTWEKDRNLARLRDDAGKALGDPSRRQDLQAFLASDATVAIAHQDFDHTPPVAPHHFILIVKDEQGVWRNIDQTSSEFRRRGGITDWNRVYDVAVDADLLAAARAKLSDASPAAG
jgi:hypothetical protein